MAGCPMHHGVAKVAEGSKHLAISHFSKLFPELPRVELSEQEAAILGGPGGLMHDFDGESIDSRIPAGYIFFSQFVDHDITLDTTSGLRDIPKSDPAEDIARIKDLPNIRSASLDLDCVYGFGPEGSPHIYDSARPGRLAINPNGYDLARSPSGVALIGDPRNDENIFISQIHLLFHRFHNKLYNDRVHASTVRSRFEEAQTQTRYHYQWLVLFDLLKRLCDPEVYKFAVPKILDPNCSGDFPYFYKLDSHKKLTMPVEFSVAAYRVGHTLVRSLYAVNEQNLDIELFDERFGTEGFSTYPESLIVDWRYMLPVDKAIVPRMCKAVDTLLADEIQSMPDAVVNSNNPNDKALAFRNLMRGNALSLPSGQAIATALSQQGYPVNPVDLKLDVDTIQVEGDNRRTKEAWKRLDSLDENGISPLRANTPLFYYILRESQVQNPNGGLRLGKVGSAILMEVFGGMLKNGPNSFVKNEPDWNPDPQVSKEHRKRSIFDWSHVWREESYEESFRRDHLINRDNFYPLELADVVRFVNATTQ